jgi:hypothetical protein
MSSLMQRIERKIVPKSRLGDWYLSRKDFIAAHGRAPDPVNGGYMDVIFFLKTSAEATLPIRTTITDKELVKDFVRERIGDEHNVPTYVVLRSMDEFLRYELPPDCVIKPTHTSGHVIFRRGGSKVNLSMIADWFETNYYNWTRERNYRDLKPKVIVEPYVFDGQHTDDFKILCIEGEPKMIWVDLDRYKGRGTHRRNIYNLDWQLLPAQIAKPNGDPVQRPKTLEQMIELARKLAQGFSLVRVDFYTDDKRVLLGEMTSFPHNAIDPFLSGEDVVTQVLFGQEGIGPFLERVLGDQRPASALARQA